MNDDKKRLGEHKMLDLIDADLVEFVLDEQGKVWVNVEGKCVLRVGKAHHVAIEAPEDRLVKVH